MKQKHRIIDVAFVLVALAALSAASKNIQPASEIYKEKPTSKSREIIPLISGTFFIMAFVIFGLGALLAVAMGWSGNQEAAGQALKLATFGGVITGAVGYGISGFYH